ncbi:phage portal protein [Streptobacillus canis]|uniref:phage portal protein n=1 Tax=Streptobacillus canis TaxID=2678686 RepID=UPI0018CC1466|nr:phage portal protein [Streptobacillus canis]
MGIFNLFNKVEERETREVNFDMFEEREVYRANPMSEITYYTCLKKLSEAVSKLNIHLYDDKNNRIYDHEVIRLLNQRPNSFMTPSIFKQTIEYSRNHKGNAYVYIKFNKFGMVEGLYPLESGNVEVVINRDIEGLPDVLYRISLNGKKHVLLPHEIIHLKSGLSEDGVIGKSAVNILKDTFDTNQKGSQFFNRLLDHGLNIKGVVEVDQSLNDTKRKVLLDVLTRDIRTNSNKNFLILPKGATMTPLNFKLTDAQFFEIRKYTSNQIAAVFGISPIYLNDYSKASYSNSEAQNLSFYTDTMLAILKQYEEELDYKLLTEQERAKGYNFKFNLSGILRGDSKTQSEAIRTLVSTGVYTVNEARVMLGKNELPNGDVNLINGTYVKLEDIGKAYEKGGVIEDDNTK